MPESKPTPNASARASAAAGPLVLGKNAAAGYAAFLADLKNRIGTARLSAARAVNRELLLLYWDIGCKIVGKQAAAGWGDSVVERLAGDLRAAFPAISGFSGRNLRDMRRFYLAYSDPEFWRQAVAKMAPRQKTPEFWRQAVADVPWGHHLLILNKITAPAARLYYLQASARLGWSRNVLRIQIKAGAFKRARLESKTHNFPDVLPRALAEQADEMLKSRYNLEFLGIHREAREREIEERLVTHLQRFILELGYGFCFVGRQHRLLLGQKDYAVDLLFYHRFIKALVAFDLKVGAFEPEHAGKMDFYLNLLNAKERAPGDQPSIGIILCAEKDDVEVEFALKTKGNPIGVAEYALRSTLPAELRGRLPTARQLAGALRQALPSR